MTTKANEEQSFYWNSLGGPQWVRYQPMLDGQLEGVGRLAMDAAAFRAGESVLDVGCGCGSTTLAIAEAVGPEGRCVGIDLSRPMLELARARGREAGVANAEFVEADAQEHAFRPAFDVLWSRFGVMFFADPVRAFANLRGALRQGGRLAFVCWQAPARNPWMIVPVLAAMAHLPAPPPPQPDAPGPFAFADEGRVRSILADAGFRDVEVRGHEVQLPLGGGASLDASVDFILHVGPVSRLMGEADAATRGRAEQAVRAALLEHAQRTGSDPDAGLSMGGAVWVVTARA